MSSETLQQPWIETQKNCRFLMFELPGQVIGFQYMSIKKLKWVQADQERTELERLDFDFDDCMIKVLGTDLRRFFPLLQNDEVFVIRCYHSGNNTEPSVMDIQFLEKEVVDVLPALKGRGFP